MNSERGFIVKAVLLLGGALFLFFLMTDDSENTDSFKVTVDPERKIILAEETRSEEVLPLPLYVLNRFRDNMASAWEDATVAFRNSWPLQLAGFGRTYVRIEAGMRKEQIADIVSQKLGWEEKERNEFLAVTSDFPLGVGEGYFAPGLYALSRFETPESLREKMTSRFHALIGSRYASSTEAIVTLPTALKIASMLEREAAGVHDMRLIAGIIWNRIFEGMRLDIDATLQYAKASKEAQKLAEKGGWKIFPEARAEEGEGEPMNWWPRVSPEDKKINSPYNTYKHAGLPPTPISAVSPEAVQAALNPRKTSCFFYIHDRYGRTHCSPTYAGHLENIRAYLNP